MGRFQFFLLTFPFALWGLLSDYPLLIVFSEIAFSILSCYSDYKKGFVKVTSNTLYSLFTLLYCYGNLMVVLSLGTENEFEYNFYLIQENISIGLMFTYLGNVACQIGFEWYSNIHVKEGLIKELNWEVDDRFFNVLKWILLGYNVLVVTMLVPPLLGSRITLPFLFVMTRYAAAKNKNNLLYFAIIIMCIECVVGLMYEYLRVAFVMPLMTVLLAYLFGKKNVKDLLSPVLTPVYIALVLFVAIFPFLGQIRTSHSGYNKLDLILMKLNDEEPENDMSSFYEPEKEGGSFAARMNNVNQTSQVVRVVNEDGYYAGTTLSYFAFAFIPRFIWPEKPMIAQGRWFAIRIGKAYVHDDGRVNNSINMTCAGELFMNFGYFGVVIGMFIIGVIASYMWNLSAFSSSDNNILGSMFGLYLFYLASSTYGIDLQFLVTLISFLLIFQFINYIKHLIV